MERHVARVYDPPVRRLLVIAAILLGASCRRAPASLADAAARGTGAELATMLAHDGGPVDAQGPHGASLLHLAAGAGNAEAVAVLLEHAATVDLRDGDSRTPLHLAAANGSEDCVRRLLAAGASWKVEDVDGRTPLLLAVAARRSAAADLLRSAAAVPLRLPPTRFLGAALRLPAPDMRFVSDTAGRASLVASLWGGGATRHAEMLRFTDRSARPLHEHNGDTHAFVSRGSLHLIGVDSLGDATLPAGAFLYLPPRTPHAFRCDAPPCLVYEEEFPSLVAGLAPSIRTGAADPVWNDDECYGRLEVVSPSHAGSHTHPFEFLSVFGHGAMRYSIADDAPMTLGSGAIAVFPAGVIHAMDCIAPGGCLRYATQCGG